MTINQQAFWKSAKVYKSPEVSDTPKETRPNNAIGSLDHFSKPVTLLKFTNPDDWDCAGIAERGEPEIHKFWCVIQSLSSQQYAEKTISSKQGEYTEGLLKLTYNPFHPSHPESGLHLQLSQDESADYSGFADVIEYQGKAWAVRQLTKMDVDYGEDYEKYAGKAVLKLIEAPVNERTTPSQGHYELR